jgi:DNA-binding beta-propeller fold protein YncE
MSLVWLGIVALSPAAGAAASQSGEIHPGEIHQLEVQSYQEDFGASVQTAERNLAIQRRGAGIVPQLEAVQGKRYAGVWFDNEAGEFVVPVLANADHADLEASLARAQLGSDSRTKPARYSWEELEAAHERIDKALLPLIEDDLVQTSLDPRTNSVVVAEAESASGTQRAEIHRVAAGERVSVELRPQAVERFEARTAACNVYGSLVRVCDKPLRAGVFIDTPNEAAGFCTAGFKAVDAYGNRFMLTAGHCYKEVGTQWRSRDSGNYAHYIGAVEGGTFPGNDWAKIRVNGITAEGDDDWWEKELSSWPSEMAYWYTTGGHDDIPISYESKSYLGQSMCHSGTTSGTSCGTVKAVDQTVNYSTGAVYHLTEATGSELITKAGDSGGPVFTSGFTALGLLSGVSATSGMLYAEITEADAALGVSVGTPIGLVPPDVTTGAATELTSTTALLSGTVNPENLPTSYHFEYGPATSPYYSWSTESEGIGSEGGTVSAKINTLEPDTAYHYRLVATNPRGTTYGEDRAFTTRPTPPSYNYSFGEEGSSQGRLSHPYGLAVDSGGNLWVADTGNNRVQEFNSKGEYLTQIGEYGYANNQLRSPIDVATDSKGNIWVIDSGNARVKKFNSKGEYLTQIGPVEAFGLATDSADNVLITDGGSNLVEKFNSNGEYLSVFGSKGSGNGQFEVPWGIEVDSEGNIWVVDYGHNRVEKFDSKGKYLTQFGQFGSGNGQFEWPTFLAIDAHNNVLVSDTFNYRIQEFNSKGEYLTQFGQFGSGNGQFNSPRGIALDSTGGTWVVDQLNNRVQRWFHGAASTESATAIGPEAATLNGTIYREGYKTQYYFEYGATTSYGTKLPTSPQSVGVGTGSVKVAQTPTGLSQGTTYHFRIVIENATGRAYGEDKSFTTLRLPKATSEAATNVKATEATLNATVNPEGSETTYQFEYGTTTSYGTKLPISSKAIGSGTNDVKVNEMATGLTPGTTYHYRIVAKSTVGTTPGADLTFTTPATPPSYSFSFGSEGSGNGQLFLPLALARDSEGNIWVADAFNNRVQKFNPEGEYLLKFGSAGSGNGQFSLPTGLDVDSAGNIWVADAGNNRVQKFNSKGEYLTQFGTKGSGNGQLSGPRALDVEPSGYVWVADYGNNRVQEFSPQGEYVRQFGSAGSGNGQFKLPTGIALDSKGNVWVSDYENNRVQKFNPEGEYLLKFGSKGSGAGQFKGPRGIGVDANDNVWVADYENSRVEEFNSSGNYIGQIGQGSGSEAEPWSPTDVFVDAEGNVWVTEGSRGRVQKWSYGGPPAVTTEAATEIASHSTILNATVNPQGFKTTYQFEYGTTTSYGSKAPASAKGIGAGGKGVKVSEKVEGLEPETTYHFRIAATSPKGTTYGSDLTFMTPTPTPSYSFSIGSAGSGNGQFSAPSDVAIDGEGNVWVAELGNNRVQKFNSKGEYQLKFGSEGTGNGQFVWPIGITTDSTGDVWVADTLNNRVQEFNSKGEYLTQFGTKGSGNGQLSTPMGLDIDSGGNVWVADSGNNRVQKFNSKGEYLLKFGSAGSGNGQFSSPRALAIDSEGDIWIADYSNNRVQEFNSKGEYLTQFGTKGSGNGQFKYPTGIAVDAKGKIWVADYENNRVQKFNSKGEYLTQFGTKGSGAGQFNVPRGIAFDSNWGMWIADYSNNRVQKWLYGP